MTVSSGTSPGKRAARRATSAVGVEVRTVRTTPAPDFLIEGVMEAAGTSESSTTFTSDADSPAAGDWQGLLFRGDSTGTLQTASKTYTTPGTYTVRLTVVDNEGFSATTAKTIS